MHNLANSYADLGRHADALQLHEETLRLRKARFGPNHSDTLLSMNNLANSYAALGRHTEALKLREEAFRLMKAKLGPNHPHTLISMGNLGESLVQLDRSAEAVPLLDDCLARAAGQAAHLRLVPFLLDIRLRAFQKQKAAAGCLETAAKWEALRRTDADSLYSAACMRAICAAVIRATDPTPAGAAKAQEQADLALAWLQQAVAAGYKDVAHLKKDTDLDPLRSRDDFKKLLAALEAEAKAAHEHRTRLDRATALAQKGEHAKAVAETAPVLAAQEVSAGLLYDAGCVYALSVAAVRKDAQLAAAEQEQRAEAYARQAIVLLRQAVARGYNDLPHLKTNDPDLQSLRGRTDFQQLAQELEAKTKAGAK
jgi:tetratricopeptide (TPR) repeat protein